MADLHAVVLRKVKKAGSDPENIDFKVMAQEIWIESGYDLYPDELKQFHKTFWNYYRPIKKGRGGRKHEMSLL